MNSFPLKTVSNIAENRNKTKRRINFLAQKYFTGEAHQICARWDVNPNRVNIKLIPDLCPSRIYAFFKSYIFSLQTECVTDGERERVRRKRKGLYKHKLSRSYTDNYHGTIFQISSDIHPRYNCKHHFDVG